MLRRTVFFDPPYIVLLDEFEAETEHRFSWIHHAYGDVGVLQTGETAPSNLPPLPTEGAWQNLRARSTQTASESIVAMWNVTDTLRLHLRLCSDGAFEITTATSPGQPYFDSQGALLLRAPGRTRRIASVFEATGVETTLQSLSLAGQDTVRVNLKDGSERVYRWE